MPLETVVFIARRWVRADLELELDMVLDRQLLTQPECLL